MDIILLFVILPIIGLYLLVVICNHFHTQQKYVFIANLDDLDICRRQEFRLQK